MRKTLGEAVARYTWKQYLRDPEVRRQLYQIQIARKLHEEAKKRAALREWIISSGWSGEEWGG